MTTTRIDDGRRCWMTPGEAAAYTGIGETRVVEALLGRQLAGVALPGPSAVHLLVARDDLDRWVQVAAGR